MIFFDTSAALALADIEDDHHDEAVRAMTRLIAEGRALLTHSYILVESAAVLQRRLGLKSTLAFYPTRATSRSTGSRPETTPRRQSC